MDNHRSKYHKNVNESLESRKVSTHLDELSPMMWLTIKMQEIPNVTLKHKQRRHVRGQIRFITSSCSYRTWPLIAFTLISHHQRGLYSGSEVLRKKVRNSKQQRYETANLFSALKYSSYFYEKNSLLTFFFFFLESLINIYVFKYSWS